MASKRIDTVLIANRGEIARRIIRTVHAMGLTAVAVYSDADADAAHVREADVAVRLGPGPAAESYLDQAAVVEAAKATGADAVHPGYGFLSENPEFGATLEAAGIAFIGPGRRALDVMADKITAKNHVAAAGVPVTPGLSEPGLDDAALAAGAEAVGFPLLIKPSAGGGGQGMVEVHDADELPAALASARRTARSAFGDDSLFLERLVTTPRHIEVQVLADANGNVVHLAERECSLQRRHQKVIEEAPAPLLLGLGERGQALREALGKAAVDAAASVGYVGAGTVEFLVSDADPEHFFFMEMNTRLQVEHPVTEQVVRVGGAPLDLVAWQIRIAAGEALDFEQADVSLEGHAVEARVYAERPSEGFLPAVGPVHAVRLPAGPGVRVDAALDGPGEVSAFYDPMIAKVIAWGAGREQALDRLDRALAQTVIASAGTNVGFLRALVADPDVRAGRLDTGLIGRHGGLTESPEPSDAEVAMLAVAAAELERRAAVAGGGVQASNAAQAGFGWEPDGFRGGGVCAAPIDVELELGGAPIRASVTSATEPDGCVRHLVARRDREGAETVLRARAEAGDGGMLADGLVFRARMGLEADAAPSLPATVVVERGETPRLWLQAGGRTTNASAILRARRVARDVEGVGGTASAADPRAIAPMTGTVSAVAVRDGERVEAGETLLIIEAMKMEHPVLAGGAGIVTLRVGVGKQVNQGEVLAVVEFEAAQDGPEQEES